MKYWLKRYESFRFKSTSFFIADSCCTLFRGFLESDMAFPLFLVKAAFFVDYTLTFSFLGIWTTKFAEAALLLPFRMYLCHKSGCLSLTFEIFKGRC
mmetsp:Transcript_20028/g.26243  ORF Transcript_20028/g.26243 Transcript_20028/m.26243 type:complete len:97 (-) Transcript_20028:72-362(-)